ncbi:MAG TPA: DUF2071 domain-containing protein [Chloroflexia bacterium]|nr:DUF2071 domain-containing protein [Chloroflexia bacterium]
MDALRDVEHRPWPIPARRWVMTQTWHNLLFAHWPVNSEDLQSLIPSTLQLDTYEGQAWVGVIAFRLSKIRLRGLPEMPLVSRFPEVNVRTYVKVGDKPGVLFLSLDTDNTLAVALARPWFRLPYIPACMSFKQGKDRVHFKSRRCGRIIRDARFEADYCPCGPAYYAPPCTLESWLTERYCYYSVGRHGRTYRCEIHHPQWRLQEARANITENTMLLSHGICPARDEPHLLYSHRMEALIWALRRTTDYGRQNT